MWRYVLLGIHLSPGMFLGFSFFFILLSDYFPLCNSGMFINYSLPWHFIQFKQSSRQTTYTSSISKLTFFKSSPEDISSLLLERGQEERETERSIDWLPTICSPTGGWTHNLGIKPSTFWLWGNAPTNWATLARVKAKLLRALNGINLVLHHTKDQFYCCGWLSAQVMVLHVPRFSPSLTPWLWRNYLPSKT